MSTKADRIHQLYSEGVSQPEICQRLGIRNKSQVARAVKRSNPSAKPAAEYEPGYPCMKPCLGHCGQMRMTYSKGMRRCDPCKADYDSNSLLPDAELHGV